MKTKSNIEKILESGGFVVTSEWGPPRGAGALGINNILCLSGDHQKFGDHPRAKNVFDIDSIQLINTVKTLRDDGKFLGGEEVKGKPILFIGAAENPLAAPFEIRAARLGKKVKAGCEFIQTQCIYNMERFSKWVGRGREGGSLGGGAVMGGGGR